MHKKYGWVGDQLVVVVGWVAHVIIVSAQVLLVLTLGLSTLDLGLTIFLFSRYYVCRYQC